MRETYFNGLVVHMSMDAVEDERGALMPIGLEKLDLRPQHAFLVTGRPGAGRGGHAHRAGRQLFVCLSGEIDVVLAYHGETVNATLCEGANAMLVSSPVWSRQNYRGQDPRLLVLSELPYDPGDYVDEPC